MARKVEILQRSEWSGGLNTVDDAFQLQENQLDDVLNMVIQQQGGISRRHGIVNLNTSNSVVSSTPKNIWTFQGMGVEHVLVQLGNDAAYSASGSATFTAINPDALTMTGTMRAASMLRVGTADSERCYIQRNAEQVGWKWDGTTATVLADSHGAYNDDVAVPNGGNMPKAKYIAAHNGFLWHAYTVESGVDKPTRVRFSHPGEPEDYRTNDFIDVGNTDDMITGLASFGETLFVFKHHSVWAITGYDADTFQATMFINGNGAVSQEAISVCRHGVAFFDEHEGVILITPDGDWEYLWHDLHNAVVDDIPHSAADGIAVGWLHHRLYVSVPWGASSVNVRTFVYDPMVAAPKRRGSRHHGTWYAYGYGVGPMVDFKRMSADPMHLACAPETPFVWQLEMHDEHMDRKGLYVTNAVWAAGIAQIVTSQNHNLAVGDMVMIEGVDPDGYNGEFMVVDIFDANEFMVEVASDPGAWASGGEVSEGFESYFQTAWFSAGIPGVRKRWRRPTLIVDNDEDATLNVKVYRDFSNVSVAREFNVMNGPPEGGAVWGTDLWGTGVWGAGPDGEQDILRGSGIGRAYAVQFRVAGPMDAPWAVNALDLRYIVQRIR